MPDNSTPPGPDRQVMARFWTLNAVRIVGLVIVLFGISAIGDRVDLPRWLAGVILAIGVGIFFGLPLVLARRWKGEK